MKTITAGALKPKLTAGPEIAFIDAREAGQYGEGHPFFAVNIPYSRLEILAATLLPCKQVPIVVVDDGDGVGEKAISALAAAGYCDLARLQGGATGWQQAGYRLFKGVNVPSKTFGELVEHEAATPSLSAEELQQRLTEEQKLILLDGRTVEEFQKMSLPTARACPNAELAYRAPILIGDEKTPVVINCAGRTRSIIGAESLRHYGLANPVYALRNGTQGWELAGFDLVHGAAATPLPPLSAAQKQDSRQRADALIRQWQLPTIAPATLAQWQADPGRTTYLFDVRSEAEFAAGHWQAAHHVPGAQHALAAQHAPGGQLVQATDRYVAVRGARIVLCDDTGLRAALTALWLRGMGHEIYLLKADCSRCDTKPAAAEIVMAGSEIAPAEAVRECENGAVLLDVSRSMDYRRGHAAPARWATRARLDLQHLPKQQKIIVTGRDKTLITGVVKDLQGAGHEPVFWFEGSCAIWQAAGFELVNSADQPSDDACIDYLFFTHDRHHGNLQAARQYLEWEIGLLDQLDAQERGVLKPPPLSSDL